MNSPECFSKNLQCSGCFCFKTNYASNPNFPNKPLSHEGCRVGHPFNFRGFQAPSPTSASQVSASVSPVERELRLRRSSSPKRVAGGRLDNNNNNNRKQEAGIRKQKRRQTTHNLSLIQFVFISLLFEIEKMTHAIYLCIEYGFAHILLTMLAFFFSLALRSLLRQIQVSKFKQECRIQLENPSYSHHSHPATGPSC